MKRLFSLLLVTAMLLTLGVNVLAQEETTITFALWDENQKPVFDEIVKVFEEENPGYKVEIQLTPWSQYWTKLDAAIGADTAADVFWMNTYLPKYAKAGVIEPLDAYIEKDQVDLDAYVPAVRDAYIIEGVTYALPKGMDTVQVFYNKAIFEANGVPLPEKGWTWDDMVALGTQLKDKIAEKGTGEYPIVMELDPQPSYFNFIPQNGGFILSEDKTMAGFDQQGTIDSYKKVLKLMEDGIMPDSKVLSDTKGTELFLSQKAAILFMGSWNALVLENASFAENIGVVPMPSMDASNVSVMGGLGFAMNANARDKDSAWKLIQFLAGETSNNMQAEGKIDMPALISSQEAYTANFTHLDTALFYEIAQSAYFFPTSEKVAEWLPVVMEYSSQILSGAITPEEGAQQIQEQMQAVLDTETK